MAFSNLSSNQIVSDSDAATAGFLLNSGQIHSYTGVMMSKLAATTKYTLDTNALSSYASNQLMPKSAWVSGIIGTSVQLVETTTQFWENICSVAWINPITKYTISGMNASLSQITDRNYQIFEDVGCTIVFSTINKTFKALENGTYKRVMGGDHSQTIVILENCPPPPSYYSYKFATSRTSSEQSCILTSFNSVWYSSALQLDMGGRLFSNSGLTTPIGGGNLWYHCQTGMTYQIDNSGYITALYNCGDGI
jgi:hypothetical protein